MYPVEFRFRDIRKAKDHTVSYRRTKYNNFRGAISEIKKSWELFYNHWYNTLRAQVSVFSLANSTIHNFFHTSTYLEYIKRIG